MTKDKPGPIKDLENYFNVEIMPMDHKGNITDGECRSLYLHKSKFKKLSRYLDKIWREPIDD